MSTNSLHDISAICLDSTEEDGEILDVIDSTKEDGESLDVIIISHNDESRNDHNNNDSFLDILKRSYDRRNVSSSLNHSLSLDETFGNSSKEPVDSTNEDPPRTSAAIKPFAIIGCRKPLKDAREIKRKLSDSFSKYDEKMAQLERSFSAEESSSPASSPVVSSFLRSVQFERARQTETSGAKGDSSQSGSRDNRVGADLTAQVINRALNKKADRMVASPLTASSPKIRSLMSVVTPATSTVTTPSPKNKPLFSFPLAPPSASTPKRAERSYSQRPALSKPVYTENRNAGDQQTKISTKRSRSPDALESDNRAKRSRGDYVEDRRVVTANRVPRSFERANHTPRQFERVDHTLRRPSFDARRHRTASCSANGGGGGGAVGSSFPLRLGSGVTFAPPRAQPPGSRNHSRARTTVGEQQCAEYNRQEMLAKLIDEKYDHVVFLDLDNWVNFFGHLNSYLPSRVFVWGFWGAQTNWRAPVGNRYFDELMRTGRFEGTMAGRDKDAADFAIVIKIAQMDKDIKKTDIGFTIVTGDRGFQQVRIDFSSSRRSVEVVNPHLLSKRNGNYGERESMDSVLRRHCRRSQSQEPKIRSPIVLCR